MIPTLEIVVITLHTCVAISSISFNLLLLFAVIRHTPKSFSTFGIMLKIHVLADLTAALGGAATMIRLIPIDWSLAYFMYGPCGFFGVQTCHFAITMMLFGMDLSFYSILGSFIFRFLAVKGRMPTVWQACGLICCVSLPLPTALTITYQSLSDENSAILNLVNEMHPEYDANSHTVEGNVDIRSIKICAVIIMLGGIFWPVYALMLTIRSRILAELDKHSNNMSNKSKRMHRKFVSMLTTQASLPIFPLIAIVSYFLGFFNIIHDPALESSTFLLGDTTAIFSPIVALYYVDPYRNAALSVFRINGLTKVSSISNSKEST